MNNLFWDFLSSKEDLREFYSWLPADGMDKIYRTINTSSQKNKDVIPVIITGQQPAVFGGPLYTIYKIITSLRLSSHLNDVYGYETQTIFWVHSWDHDWEEVCSINFLTYKYEILSFSFTPEIIERGKPLYRLPLDKNYIRQQTIEIFRNIKGSEFSDIWCKFLLDSISDNDNLSDWAIYILKRIFNNGSLTFFEPHKTTDYKQFQNLIEIAIDNHPLLFNRFNKTNTSLKQLGYKPQVHKVPENAFFFLDENGYRSKIKFQNGNFFSEVSHKEYSVSEIKKILNNEPERFSPNLLLRCIYQQMIFPCVIYVGGPAEVAYWAQMKDLFSFFDLSMPIIYPRCRLILLPSKIKKWLSEINVEVDNLPQIHNKIKSDNLALMSITQKNEIEKAKNKFINSAVEFFNNLSTIFNDKDFDNQQKTYLSKIEIEAQKLIETFVKSQKNKNEIYQKHLYCILNTIFPNTSEQERVFSPFSFIPEFGDDFIKKIMNRIDIEKHEAGIIEL